MILKTGNTGIVLFENTASWSIHLRFGVCNETFLFLSVSRKLYQQRIIWVKFTNRCFTQVSDVVDELSNTRSKYFTGGILLFSIDPQRVLNGASIIQFILPFEHFNACHML